MNLIVHYPTKEHELLALNDRVARIHGEYIYSYLSKKEFSKEQKIKILENIRSRG